MTGKRFWFILYPSLKSVVNNSSGDKRSVQRRASATNWRFASSQSDSLSPGKANLRRRSEMK